VIYHVAMNLDEIRRLVDSELAEATDAGERDRLAALLATPEQIKLDWEYGKAGEQLSCWRVGRSPEENPCRLWLVYCQQGFGPSFPWGFVETDSASMGIDAQWHSSLVAAAICCGLLPPPPGYEAPGPRE
jgi:hypothetical protein